MGRIQLRADPQESLVTAVGFRDRIFSAPNALRFDPPTLVWVLLAALLPTGLLVVISWLGLTGVGISLYPILEKPHVDRVRERVETMGAEIDRLGLRLGDSVLNLIDPSLGGPVDRGLIDQLTRIDWFPPVHQSHQNRPEVGGDPVASLLLRTLAAEEDSTKRKLLIEELSRLPRDVEDELGFPCSIEASRYLERQGGGTDPLEFLARPPLELSSRRALQDDLRESVIAEGIPVPVVLSRTPSPAAGSAFRLTSDGQEVELDVVTPGAAQLTVAIPAEAFLTAALTATSERLETPEGIFFALSRVEDSASEEWPRSQGEGRVWAARPLVAPFDGHFQILEGTTAGSPSVPLSLLRRLEGIHYLWAGLLVVALACGASLLLATMAARRVRESMEQDHFLRLVSHELRTPISSIRMISETLAMERFRSEEERCEFLKQLEIEAQRLGTLVERVLEQGKSSQPGSLHSELVDHPEKIVEEAIDTFEEQQASISLRDGIPGPAPVTLASRTRVSPAQLDREAVRGVVWNLLDNARKYGPRDEPIEVEVADVDHLLTISVRDRGPGIRRRDQKFIFDRFWRGAEGKSLPGFGLGLAYCQQVARAHRGKITLETGQGNGSTFTLKIPRETTRREDADGPDTGC